MELYEVRENPSDYELLVVTDDGEFTFPLWFAARSIFINDKRRPALYEWYPGVEVPEGAMEVFSNATLFSEEKVVATGNLFLFVHQRDQKVILHVRGGQVLRKGADLDQVAAFNSPLLRFIQSL